MASTVDQVKELIGSKLSDEELTKFVSLLSDRSVKFEGTATGAAIITGDGDNNITTNNNFNTFNITQSTKRSELLELLDQLEKQQQLPVRCKTRSMLITSVGIGVVVGILRFYAGLQGLEIGALDGLMAAQQPFAQEDHRILVIAPDDAEVQQQGKEVNERSISFTDDKLAEVLEKIQTYHPTVIGLDLQRPFAAKGKLAAILHPKLAAQPGQRSVVPVAKGTKPHKPVKQQPSNATVTPSVTPSVAIAIATKSDSLNLVGACKALETLDDGAGHAQPKEGTEKAPPPEIAPEKIGFTDFITGVGNRGISRRQILAQNPPEGSQTCTTTLAFSTQIAKQFLSKEHGYNQFNTRPMEDQCLQFLNQKTQSSFSFPLFKPGTGGFQGGENEQGCQMILNYGTKTIKSIRLRDIDKVGRDPANLPKIILIGSAAHGQNDMWLTPLGEMEGAMIQALTVRQIIDTVLGKQRLIWALPEGVDFLWILGWSFLGGVLGWRLRFWQPWLLALTVATLSLYLVCGLSFWLGQLWLPLVPPLMTLLTSGTSVAYLNFRRKFGSSNPFQILRAALSESNSVNN